MIDKGLVILKLTLSKRHTKLEVPDFVDSLNKVLDWTVEQPDYIKYGDISRELDKYYSNKMGGELGKMNVEFNKIKEFLRKQDTD